MRRRSPCHASACAAAALLTSLHVGQQHVARQRRLAGAGDAGDGDQALQRHVDVDVAAGCAAWRRAWSAAVASLPRPSRRSARPRGAPAAGASAAARGSGRSPTRAAPPGRPRVPCATTRPPRLPAPGPMSMMWSARRIVSSSCSTTTSVLPLSPSLCSASSRIAVVARVQADGRLVEHVADALQVAAELRRQADALRLAAARASARRGPASGSPGRPPPGTRAGC